MDKEETKTCDCKDCDCKNCNCGHGWRNHRHHYRGGGGLYFFGFIGAIFYFLQHAVTTSDYLWGILKAIVWPALLVFKAFTMLRI